MNEELDSEARRGLSRFVVVLVKVVLGIVLLLFPLPLFLGPRNASVLGVLIVGWASFLIRTLPRITWNADLVGMAVICITLILGGTQWFMDWICRHRGAAIGAEEGTCRWPWRRTWCGVVGIGLTFLIGSSLVGAVHQIGWIRSSDEPMMEVRRGGSPIASRVQIQGAFDTALLESGGKFEAARRLVWDPEVRYLARSEKLRETFHILAIVSSDNQFPGLIIFPRDAGERARSGGLYCLGPERKPVTGEQISELLARNRLELRTI